MNTLRRWILQIRGSLTRDLGEARFQIEMQDHIEHQTTEYIHAGLVPGGPSTGDTQVWISDSGQRDLPG